MATLHRWVVQCATCEEVTEHWQTAAPTECPADPAHEVSVAKTAPAVGAPSEFYLNDGVDVFKVEMNGTGDGLTFAKVT